MIVLYLIRFTLINESWSEVNSNVFLIKFPNQIWRREKIFAACDISHYSKVQSREVVIHVLLIILTCLVFSLSLSHFHASALPVFNSKLHALPRLSFFINVLFYWVTTPLFFPPSHCSQEDVKSLTAHIVENYWKALEDVDYVQTFKGLKLRYEQQRERQDNPKLDRWENQSKPLLQLLHCHWWINDLGNPCESVINRLNK